MPYYYLLSALLFTIGNTALCQSTDSTKHRRAPDFVMLQVENTEPDTNDAQYLAVGYNDNPSVIWKEASQSVIMEGNPYFLYCRGNQVGTYTAIRIEEDEIASWIVGVTKLLDGLKPSDLDSIGADSFTAISQKHIIKSTCKQPRGDGKDDFIRTKVTQSSGSIDLIFGSGGIQHIDSVKQNGRLESIFIQDIFDLDNDGIPEVLTTFNTYPTFTFVLYKYDAGRWKRIYEVFGGGC
jgi:hypothetical protein